MSYIAIGARTDCRNIIERFCKLKSLRYHLFTQIWRELKFPYIYYGHNCLEELMEFTEEVLRIAKELWLKSDLISEKVGGLYTLYGLYVKQPTDGIVKVRLTSQDIELVEKFHDEVRTNGHHDANYIISRMHVMGAFRYCISEYSYGLEKCIRRYHESDRSLQEIKEEPSYIKRLKNEDFFIKLEDAFTQYHKSKCRLVSDKSSKPPSLLNYADPQFPQHLKEEFQKITHSNDDAMTQDTESVGTQATSDEVSSSGPSSTKFKLPWWMLPVQNHTQKDSSSDSEAENDADNPNETMMGEGSSQDELNVVLGMSEDEEVVDAQMGDADVQHQKENFKASDSHDMPSLLSE